MKVKGSKKFHFVKFLKKALILSGFGTVSEIWISLKNVVTLSKHREEPQRLLFLCPKCPKKGKKEERSR